MRYRLTAILVFTCLASAAHGQSLGDVAREQRQKQADKPGATHKVITDDDLPARPADTTDADVDKKSSKPDDATPPINSASNGEQVKAQFVAAKQQIKDYQAQLDQLRASIHYVDANGYSNGVQYNQHQQRKQQEADRMQHQLEAAQKKLEQMQEEARKAGFGSSVYDP